MRLTEKQQGVHDFICGYVAARGYAPTIGEIQQRFRLSSPASAHQVLSALVKKGFLRRVPNIARGLEVVKSGHHSDLLRLPLRGLVSAGKPLEPVETFDPIQVPRWMVRSENAFALKVSGDSMIGDNLFDGDLILVEPAKTARNGQTVIALINGCETTLKRFRRVGNTVYLAPRNPRYKTLVVRPPDTVEIQGILIRSVHSYED